MKEGRKRGREEERKGGKESGRQECCEGNHAEKGSVGWQRGGPGDLEGGCCSLTSCLSPIPALSVPDITAHPGHWDFPPLWTWLLISWYVFLMLLVFISHLPSLTVSSLRAGLSCFYMFGSYARVQCLEAQKLDFKKTKNKISIVEKLSKFTFSVFSFSLVSEVVCMIHGHHSWRILLLLLSRPACAFHRCRNSHVVRLAINEGPPWLGSSAHNEDSQQAWMDLK